MKVYSRIASLVFGVTMLALSAIVTIETIVRKLFSISLGGADELSGYAIAVAAPLAFAVALIERSHIRINLLYMRMSVGLKGLFNALSMITLALLAIFLLFFTIDTVIDTQAYQSIAQTPWATPLIYPQSLWLIAMGLFAVPAAYLGARTLLLLMSRNWSELNKNFSPESADEELEAELEDLKQR